MKTIKPSVKTIASLDKNEAFDPLEYLVVYTALQALDVKSMPEPLVGPIVAVEITTSLHLEANRTITIASDDDLKAYREKLGAWSLVHEAFSLEEHQDWLVAGMQQVKANLEHHLKNDPASDGYGERVEGQLKTLNEVLPELLKRVSERDKVTENNQEAAA